MKKIAKYGLLCTTVMFAGVSSLSAKTFTAKEIAEKTSTTEMVDGVAETTQENVYVFGSHAFINSFTTLNIVDATPTLDFNETPTLYLKNSSGAWRDALRPNNNVNIKDNTTFEITKMIKPKSGNQSTITGEGTMVSDSNYLIETFESSGNPSVPVVPDTESNLNVVSAVKKDGTDTEGNFTVSYDSTKKTLVINEVNPVVASTTVSLDVDFGKELSGNPLVYTTIDGFATANPAVTKNGTKTTIVIPETNKSYENVALMFIDETESTLIYVTYNAKEEVTLNVTTNLADDETVSVKTAGVTFDTKTKTFTSSNKTAFEFAITKNDVDTGKVTTTNYNANYNTTTKAWECTKDLELVSVQPIKAFKYNGNTTLTNNLKQNTTNLSVGALRENSLNITVNGPMVTFKTADYSATEIKGKPVGEVYGLLVDLGVDTTNLKIGKVNAQGVVEEDNSIQTTTGNDVKNYSNNPDSLTNTTFVVWLTKESTRELVFYDDTNKENKETLTINMTNNYTPFALKDVKAANNVTDVVENQKNITVSKPDCSNGTCKVNVKETDVFTGNYALILDFGTESFTTAETLVAEADEKKYGVVANGTQVAITNLPQSDKTITVTNDETNETITVEIKYTQIEKVEFEVEGTVSNITVTKQAKADNTTATDTITATAPNYVKLTNNQSYFAMTKADKVLEFTFKVGNDTYIATRSNASAPFEKTKIVKVFNLKGVTGGSYDGLAVEYNQNSIYRVTSNEKAEDGTPIINVEFNRALNGNDTTKTYYLVLDLGTDNANVSNANIDSTETAKVDKYLVGKNLTASESVVLNLNANTTDYIENDGNDLARTITFTNDNSGKTFKVIVRSTYVKTSGIDYLELKSVNGLKVADKDLEAVDSNYVPYNNNSIENISISKDTPNTIDVVINRKLQEKTPKVGILVDLGKNPIAEKDKELTTGIMTNSALLADGTDLVVTPSKVATYGGSGNQFVVWVGVGTKTITFRNNYESNKEQELKLTINVKENFEKVTPVGAIADLYKSDGNNGYTYTYVPVTKANEYPGTDPEAITVNGVKYSKEAYTLIINGETVTGPVYNINASKQLEVARAILELNATNDSSFDIKFGISKTFKAQVFDISNPKLDLGKAGTELNSDRNGNITITATAKDTVSGNTVTRAKAEGLTLYNNDKAFATTDAKAPKYVFTVRTVTKTDDNNETVTNTEIKAIPVNNGVFDLEYYTDSDRDNNLKAGETKTENVTVIVPGYGKLNVTLKVTKAN